MGSRIENNDITNPYTNKPLPIDFIEKIKRLNKTKKKEDIIQEEKIPEKIHIGHLAPGLLEIIRNDINRIIDLKSSIAKVDSGPQEDEYNNKKLLYLNDEIEEIFNQDGYSSGGEDYFNDGDTIDGFLKDINDSRHDEEGENDGHHGDKHYHEEDVGLLKHNDEHHDEEGENDGHNDDDDKHDEEDDDKHHDKEEEDDEDKHHEENDGHHDEEDDDDYTIDDTDDESIIAVSDVEYDLDSVIPEICKYCSNDIVNKKYKSILWNGKGIDNVAFCSIKCIENFDWKKYKCKIKKKKNL